MATGKVTFPSRSPFSFSYRHNSANPSTQTQLEFSGRLPMTLEWLAPPRKTLLRRRLKAHNRRMRLRLSGAGITASTGDTTLARSRSSSESKIDDPELKTVTLTACQ